jgi:rhamnose transport system substrate-binding protein
MTTLRRRRAGLAALIAVTAIGVAGCGDSSDSGGGSTGGGAGAGPIDVAFVPKNTDNPYFQAVAVGAQEASQELKGKFKNQGTAAPDVPGQIRIITSLAQQRQPVIAVSALDPNADAPAMERASRLGSKVISYDADVKPEARQLFVNQASSEALGVTQAKIMADLVDHTGKIAILSAQITAANQNAWIRFMKQELAKPENTGIEIVKIAYGNDESKLSYDQAVSLLQGFPDLKGIISPTPVGLDAAAKAIKDLNRTGKVQLTGLGFPPGDKQLLTSGQVDKYVLWSPRDLGYLTYYAANALHTGEISGEQGESFQAGKLGKKTVGPQGEILLGPPQVFTKDNVDRYMSEFATE